MKLPPIPDFVEWELQYFRDNCNFSDEELECFNLRAKNKSNTSIYNVCSELKEFIQTLYSSTDTQAERDAIVSMIKQLNI